MQKLRHCCLKLVLVILVAIFKNAESSRYGRARMEAAAEEPGDPLYLTQLIESGRIEDAQRMARVQHPEMFDLISYAGYLTIDKAYNSNMFFWYFPAKVDPANAPVLLYLEGGPGASSLFGLFIHNGPFIVSPNQTVSLRNESWSNTHNLIYIDNPVGTGWSFTNNEAGYARNDTQVGEQIRLTLVQFFRLFPSLRKNDFFVSGESYAGKFVPAVCHAIHLWNPTTETDKINLKGMAIGNGFTDPLNQLVYGDFLYQVGLIDENGRDEFYALEQRVRDLILQDKHSEAVVVAGRLVDGSPTEPPTLFKNLTGFDWNFNILKTTDPIRVEYAYGWFQRNDVRRAIRVGNVSFNTWGANVAGYLTNDATRSQAHHVAELLEHYRVLVYTGQLDIVVGYSTVKNYLRKLCWSGSEDYKRAPRKQWKVDGELAGYVKTVGNLKDVLIRNGGHVVAMDQPKWTLDMLEKFTRGLEL